MPPRGLLRGQIGGWNVSGSWNQSGFMEVLKVVSGTYRATPFFTVYVGADSKSSNSNVIQVGTRGCGHRGGHRGAAGCPYRPSAPSPGGPVGAFPPLPGLLPEQDGQRAGERGESPPGSWCRGGARPGPMGGGVPRMGLSRLLGVPPGAGRLPGLHGGAGHAAGGGQGAHPAADAAGAGLRDPAGQHHRAPSRAAGRREDLPQDEHRRAAGGQGWGKKTNKKKTLGTSPGPLLVLQPQGWWGVTGKELLGQGRDLGC